MISEISRFTIRVYGLLINELNQVLLVHERMPTMEFTKFPGGGLEFGEGTKDCLIREFKEETGLDVSVGEHIYTTDFYQVSAFNPNHQIISIYYFVQTAEPILLATKEKPFDFTAEQIADKNGQSEVCRWIEWKNFSADDVHLPIDKIVVDLLKTKATFPSLRSSSL